jgi:hypothetical protein
MAAVRLAVVVVGGADLVGFGLGDTAGVFLGVGSARAWAEPR